MKSLSASLLLLLIPLCFNAGCTKKSTDTPAATTPAKHEHHAPHAGTPVVLGNEAYHLEIVIDANSGVIQAYVLDGEMENFMRSSLSSLDVTATVNGQPQVLNLKAIANSATGETVGDTSLFQAQVDWLKTTKNFDAVLKTITIRGTTFSDVKFNFPKGNDDDAK